MGYIGNDRKYTDRFTDERVTQIKEIFKRECISDPRYSDEYKSHIENTDNIKVDIRENTTYYLTGDREFEFDVYTEFKGEIFICSNLSSLDEITSDGPFSNHYQKYDILAQNSIYEFNSSGWGARKIYFVGAFVSFLIGIWLIYTLVSGNGDDLSRSEIEMIGMIAAMTVIAIITACAALHKRIVEYSEEVSYDPHENVADLILELEFDFESQKRRSAKHAVAWLCLILAVSALFVLLSA